MTINVGLRSGTESDVLSHPLEGMMIAPPPAVAGIGLSLASATALATGTRGD
jgi:hypothetical protein